MSDLNELSIVDLEIEKLKLQSDFEVSEKNGEDKIMVIGLDSCLYPDVFYNRYSSEGYIGAGFPKDVELREQILKDWNDFIKASYCETILILQRIMHDEIKMDLYEKLKEDSNESGYNDARILAELVATLDDDEQKLEYLKQISECSIDSEGVFLDTAEIEDMMYMAKEEGIDGYTEEYCMKILKDRYMAQIIVTLEDPDIMMEYYKQMNDVHARQMVIEAIEEEFPEYSRELTIEELHEVSDRMKEEVSKVEALNAQTRAGLEKEIMAALKSLTKAKQEYARLTKETSKEDSLDLE